MPSLISQSHSPSVPLHRTLVAWSLSGAGVYKEVGAALHSNPTGLGFFTLFRSIVQSSCYPIAAYLAVRHNRAHVIALGAFLWAAATFLVAFSSTFFQFDRSIPHRFTHRLGF